MSPPSRRPFLSLETFAYLSVTLLLSLVLTAVLLSHHASLHRDAAAAMVHSQPLSLLDEVSPLPPLFPLRLRDYVGYALAMSGLILAAGGGIGGGGILVPVYTLVLQFPVKHAIPLTAVTVLGGAVANNLCNWSKRHPLHPDYRSLIDWDVILMLEPTTIAGAIIGALLHEFLPALLIVIMLLLLLLLTAYMTLKKALQLHRKETQAMELAVEAAALLATRQTGSDSEQGAISMHATQSHASGSYGATGGDSVPLPNDKDIPVETLKEMIAEENRQDAIKLTGLFVVVTAINLLKGGLEGGSVVAKSDGDADQTLVVEPVSPASPVVVLPKCGTMCFWAANVAILAVITAFMVWTRNKMLRRLALGGPVLSDIAWNQHNSVIYPVYAIVAGIVAGLFGIGGGIVKGPLMLALGVHPAVASATSACMIFFTSSTAVLSFMVFGLLTVDYAVAFLLVGFISTLVGQSAISLLMQKNKRHSYIAFSIGIVIALSAVCMTAESFLAYQEGTQVEERRLYF